MPPGEDLVASAVRGGVDDADVDVVAEEVPVTTGVECCSLDASRSA